jgi:hypothetical protein
MSVPSGLHFVVVAHENQSQPARLHSGSVVIDSQLAPVGWQRVPAHS